MSGWTPEPWNDGTHRKRVVGPVGRVVPCEALTGQDIRIVPWIDYDRALACVNACKGINPETVPMMVKALRGLAAYPDSFYVGSANEHLFEAAKAALAKATEVK